KAVGSDQVLPICNVSFTIHVTNGSGDAATNAQINDTLPGDMTLVSFQQTSGPIWSCTTPPAGSGGTVSCTKASLAGGSTSTFVLTGHIPSAEPSGTVYDNVASVTSSSDPNPENDSADA